MESTLSADETLYYSLQYRTKAAIKQRSNRKGKKMKNKSFILALDAHNGQSQLAAIDESGKILSCRHCSTAAPALIEAVSKFKGQTRLVVEESHIADWIKRTLEPYVSELVVADPKVNSWIANGENINDTVAAVRLARLFRGGYINPVYHPDSKRQQFKELVLHYHDLTRQIVSFKNKLKSEFNGKAVCVKGPRVYSEKGFHSAIKNLEPFTETSFQANHYFDIIQHIVNKKLATLKRIRSYYEIYPEINQMRQLAGIDQVTAFTISALIDTPYRFSNKRKLWSYVGLSKSEKISNNRIYRSGASKGGNRLLKYLLLQAAMRILRSKKETTFKAIADRLEKLGVNPKNIRRSVARKIITVIISIWKSGETYRPQNCMLEQN